MEPLTLRDRAAIAGVGQTEFSKASGRSELQLAAEASWAAIDDAGLHAADIDGMVTFGSDTNDELELMTALGIPVLHWTSRTPGGGGHSAGNIGPDGTLPVNTHGGLLGEGYIHEMNNVIEGTRQLRGVAANQVEGVEHVLVASGRSAIILRGA